MSSHGSTRQYELVYIALPDSTDEVLADLHQQVVAVVERFGGTIERTEPWGRRRLAYDINNQREGTYVLEVINDEGQLTPLKPGSKLRVKEGMKFFEQVPCGGSS